MKSTSSSKHKVQKSKAIDADRLAESMSTFFEAVERKCSVKLTLPRSRPEAAILTSEQAAISIGVAPKTLANWRNVGKGPVFHKVGSRCFYERTDILEFKRASRFSSTSGYPDKSPSKSRGK